MVFNSVEFCIFFVVVTGLYFALPQKLRWPMLLTASAFFYMFFKPIYILILFFTILVDFFAGILLERIETPGKKKLALAASVAANIGVLAIFKYYNFLLGNIDFFLHANGHAVKLPYLHILLPIGLSFHTFQAMSYTIEVFRGNIKAEKNFGIYALYVMFYPQLVAGPIERPQNILPQLKQYHAFSSFAFTNGLKLILWGLFKKVVIADNLSEIVNLAYNYPGDYNSMSILLACLFFSFQIYCDFSGYSDIAIGTAGIMGINLMKNFDRPYLSESIAEFWGRWHISLSTWFRDYLYIPLGGNRGTKARTYSNQMTVFLLSGLWHGASWTFVLWGSIHGFFTILESIIKAWIRPGKIADHFFIKLIKKIYVFAVVSFAWIFFRAKDFHSAHDIIYRLLHWSMVDIASLPFGGERNFLVSLSCALILGLLLFEACQGRRSYLDMINGWAKPWRWLFLTVLILALFMFGAFHNSSEFIYFQF